MNSLAILAISAGLLAGGGSTVSPCEKAMIGHGKADWRGESIVAGPVGVRRQPLRMMSQTKKGLVAKMPILVEGREPETVTVSVPPNLRKRVFLYFGGANYFVEDRGFSEVEFEPCGNKPRTIWPGGIRVKGKAPVRLEVLTEGRDEPFFLRLGKPKLYEPAS
jgi:hypothetical protein